MITARSDTMDGVMMALIVLALLFIVLAGQSGHTAWLLAGAAALGLAFNVKLLESLVALPALALLAYLVLPGTRPARLLRLLAAGAVYVVIALSWLTATLLAPAHDRPWAIGSTNGSAWNAAFVFNGSDRLGGKSPEPGGIVYEPGHRYPTATQSERDHIPITPPSPARLLTTIGPLSGERLGLELLIGLLLGIPAFISTVRARPRSRARFAAAASLSLWTLTGIVLFSDMTRLHPRYVEGFLPAVAAMLGIGVAWAASQRSRARIAALIIALAVAVYYAERLLYGRPAAWWITLGGALGAIALVIVGQLRGDGARGRDAGADETPASGQPAFAAQPISAARPTSPVQPVPAVEPAAAVQPAPAAQPPMTPTPPTAPQRGRRRSPLLVGGLIALTLVSVLAVPLASDITSIRTT